MSWLCLNDGDVLIVLILVYFWSVYIRLYVNDGLLTSKWLCRDNENSNNHPDNVFRRRPLTERYFDMILNYNT